MSVQMVYHRSYFHYSICRVNIYGMNKLQLHHIMTLLVKVKSIVQTIATPWPLQASVCFVLILLKVFMRVCSVLVQEESPSMCFRKPGC